MEGNSRRYGAATRQLLRDWRLNFFVRSRARPPNEIPGLQHRASFLLPVGTSWGNKGLFISESWSFFFVIVLLKLSRTLACFADLLKPQI
jgi:hypothetical protein